MTGRGWSMITSWQQPTHYARPVRIFSSATVAYLTNIAVGFPFLNRLGLSPCGSRPEPLSSVTTHGPHSSSLYANVSSLLARYIQITACSGPEITGLKNQAKQRVCQRGFREKPKNPSCHPLTVQGQVSERFISSSSRRPSCASPTPVLGTLDPLRGHAERLPATMAGRC